MSQAPPKNGLYYTPKEIESINEGIGKTDTGGGKDWYTDRVGEGVSIGKGGKIKREGFAYWDQFNPFTQQDESTVKGIAEGKGKARDASIIQSTTKGADLEQLETTLGDRTLTADNVHSLVRSSEREVAGRPTKVQEAAIATGVRADERAQSMLEEQIRQSGITNKRLDYQWEVAQMNDRRDRAERLDNKAEERRDRLDLLDRQDHRYSQEMQRYDKRRKTETIQGLIGGLASLGAAFAM